MLLEDLYQRLSYGELNNLSMSADGSGTILEESQPRITLYANEALVRLYTTFVLRTNSLILTPVDYITNYHLTRKYAESNPHCEYGAVPYIRDLVAEPFAEDVIKILEVFNECGNPVALNDAEDPLSVFTPQANMLQVPGAYAGQVLTLLYQASHPVLSVKNSHAIIDVPDVLHGALTAFIAHKVYGHMNTAESSAKAQEHLATFVGICADVVEKDLVATSILQSNTQFTKRGWI